MSREAFESVQDYSKADHYGRNVMYAIARFVPPTGGEVQVTARRLAELSGCDEDTVRNRVAWLVSNDELTVRKEGAGRGTRIFYTLKLPMRCPRYDSGDQREVVTCGAESKIDRLVAKMDAVADKLDRVAEQIGDLIARMDQSAQTITDNTRPAIGTNTQIITDEAAAGIPGKTPIITDGITDNTRPAIGTNTINTKEYKYKKHKDSSPPTPPPGDGNGKGVFLTGGGSVPSQPPIWGQTEPGRVVMDFLTLLESRGRFHAPPRTNTQEFADGWDLAAQELLVLAQGGVPETKALMGRVMDEMDHLCLTYTRPRSLVTTARKLVKGSSPQGDSQSDFRREFELVLSEMGSRGRRAFVRWEIPDDVRRAVDIMTNGLDKLAGNEPRRYFGDFVEALKIARKGTHANTITL